jgi:hypothetical protein
MVLHDDALRDRLQQGVTHYLNSDSTAANQWIEEHFDRLDQPQKNQVLAAQHLHHLNDLGDDEHTKLNELRELSDQITDLSIRKKVRDDIWLKEREMVRTTVDSEPQKAIEELVAGKSPYDAYWIEEAMDVWMEKDSAQAEQWYMTTGKHCPKTKRNMPQHRSQNKQSQLATLMQQRNGFHSFKTPKPKNESRAN